MRLDTEVLFLNNDEVQELLKPADVQNTVEKVFQSLGRGCVKHSWREPLWMGDIGSNMFLPMPGWISDENLAGLKWINFYHTPSEGYPSSHGNLVVLNHADTGSPYAIVEATYITTMRTGGGHGVIAAKHLARGDSKVLTVIGCGAEGYFAVKGFQEQFGLDCIKLCDLREESLERCKCAVGKNIRVETYSDAEQACKGSDIIALTTTSRKPIVKEGMVEAGATIIGLNSFHDLDPAYSSGRYKWILGNKLSDDLEIIRDPSLKEAGLSMSNVSADLGEVVTKKYPGRQNDEEIIVYTHMGMGALDLACADLAYSRAVQRGIGTKLVFKA